MMGILKQGINLGQSSLPEVWRMGHCLSWYTKTDIGILKEHIILWSCVHRYVSTMCLMYVRAMCLAPRHKTLGPVSRFFPLLLSTSLQGRSPPRVVSPPLLLVQLWSLRCFLYHCVVLILLFFFFFSLFLPLQLGPKFFEFWDSRLSLAHLAQKAPEHIHMNSLLGNLPFF